MKILRNYTVSDNYIRCGSLWGLEIDNNHADFVIVFLGDLDKLSNDEQLYWKSFNVVPEGTMSSTTIKRSLYAKFSKPIRKDLIFKERFPIFNQKWSIKFGWPLFKPLRKEDFQYFHSLHIPLTNNSLEFERQILSINKIIIDSINEKEIKRLTKLSVKNLRGIQKLRVFLKENGVNNFDHYIDFLKNLYNLRSHSAAHRKSENYEKIKKSFKIGEIPFDLVFEKILKEIIEFMEFLDEKFV